ncbi:MAG TPA: fimbria/pilus outer membrane usher protein [Steroidobacter sp.]|uniref:fimbria/pilus outer membrane usher protein n=1 Tax=Steroidobacter sp. TaxID=1978227 RepID=UPI002EDB9C8B
MTSTIRTISILFSALALVACAAPQVSEPETVAVRATSLNPSYSSVNAQILSDAAKIDSSFTATLDPEVGVDTVTRLQSSYTQEVGDESLRVGDAVSSVGMWGTSVRYGGMQFGTSSETRADVIASNRMATAGMAVLPTVADALFASASDAGSNLGQQNLSVDRSLPSGGQGWNLAVQDALGHSQSIAAPMIARTRLVEEGCSDFSVGIGKVREDYALTSNSYGPMFANTTVACGAPLGFTVEGHGEYLADEVTALGFGVARQFGSLGTASVAFAQSNDVSGASGWMSKVGFDHSNSMFNLMVRSRFQSREFRDIGSMALTDPIMQRDLASVGVNVTERASLSVAYATQTTWARERTNLIALKQSMGVGRGTMSMSAGHSLEDNFGSSVFISYKRPFGGIKPWSRRVADEIEELDLQLPQSMQSVDN